MKNLLHGLKLDCFYRLSDNNKEEGFAYPVSWDLG